MTDGMKYHERDFYIFGSVWKFDAMFVAPVEISVPVSAIASSY